MVDQSCLLTEWLYVMNPLHSFVLSIVKHSSAVCLQRLLFLTYMHLLTRCKFCRSYPGLGFTA